MTFPEKFNIPLKKKFVVLIAPLDWGLGHASRCIPIIKYLKSIDCDVIVAVSGTQKSLLLEEFPGLKVVQLVGYGVTFSKNRAKTLIKILGQIPKILISINRERKWLETFIIENELDLIISDNRYGLTNSGVASVFITHQLTIKTPFGSFLETVLRRINYHYINQFDECWVPDFEDEQNMGGLMSHPKKMPGVPVKYIGRLSRIVEDTVNGSNVQLLIILSGPEPQRTIFEEILLLQLQTYNQTAVLVRGLPGETNTLRNQNKNLLIYNHLSSLSLNQYLNRAAFIISRSGYSTVMDLLGLSKKCIFVPTPGQSEQEYLAVYLSSRKLCVNFEQDSFELEKAIAYASSYEFSQFKHAEGDQYKKVIAEFFARHHRIAKK